MQELDLRDMWFQQDGATCHKSRVTMDLSVNIFARPANWPLRSCDLTPLDYFLLKVNTDKPASIDALKDNIEAFIREIPAKMLERVCQNKTKRT